MKKKNTAVVGAGWFGRAHIRNFNELSNLVGICDVDKTKLDQIAQQYNINTYTNVDDLIKSEKIDAISIVTPPRFIPEIAKKSAMAGIDILMEKPMALNAEDLTSLCEFENSIRILPSLIELYNPVFEKLLKHLDEIGDVLSITSRRIGLYPRRDWQMGVILDLSIHDIYLQERILGKENFVNALGIKKCYKDGVHADAAFIVLDFGNAIGHIESNWLTPSKFRKMYVNGENGGIILDFISQKIDVSTGIDLQGEWPIHKEVTYSPLRADEPLKREIMNFLYDKKPLVTLDDGIRALKIALKIVNS
ncbi:MAG: Gfo/Idh/MocA family protein [Promethearchaeota archaeon]